MTTKVICIAGQKGGVEKTTTAVPLAHGRSQKGRHTLLVDLDPLGQCASALDLSPESGAFHLLTMGTTPQKNTFVESRMCFSGRQGLYLLPGDQQTMAAQTVLNAQDKPISWIRESIQRFFKDGLHLRILLTFRDEQLPENNATLEHLGERLGDSLLPPIHRSPLLRACIAEGRSIFELGPLCRAAREYQALTGRVMNFQG
ncbi:MAG: hypothetical protein C3F07_01855 [Anaerolineales bacterium]|nr:ParA family protein [Anaerolineae bacterium]PWB77584.1 MAG: hypothetical protein C3F07_01855 [Anaerolineales bacterium]